MRKILRPFLMILIIVICISLASCNAPQSLSDAFDFVFPKKGIKEDTSLGYTEVKPEMLTFSKEYIPVYDDISYSFLENDGERELYKRLLENVYFIYPQIDPDISDETVNYYKTKQIVLEDHVLTQAQVRTVIKALTDDHPQIFWLSQTFGYKTEQDRNYTAVQMYSSMSAKEVTKYLSLFIEEANRFFAEVPAGLNAYQIEKYVHDYICDNCEYDTDAAEDETAMRLNSNAFNVCGVMLDKKAVCEGYSRTFQFMCKNLGVKCVDIIGMSDDAHHMWNAVSLGDDWYYVDVTWDDTATEDYSKYDYLNINEEILLEDHTISRLFSELSEDEINGQGDTEASTMNMFIPTCDQMAYNYYVRTLAHLTDYDGEAVIAAMYDAAEDEKPYVQIYIDPASLDYGEAVEVLLNKEDPLLRKYIDTVNSMLEGARIDATSVGYIKKEVRKVLTLIFEYD